MKNTEYKCAKCGGIFEKDWSDADALEECVNRFGKEIINEELCIVCDDCYKQILAQKR